MKKNYLDNHTNQNIFKKINIELLVFIFYDKR